MNELNPQACLSNENKKLHDAIHAIVEVERKENEVTYNTGLPYQCYERIKFEGLRWSVEKRISQYGLEVLFDPKASVLDIGSNFGFFVNEFAWHCASACGVEPNTKLNDIGRITAEFLDLTDKAIFKDTPFEKFPEDQVYDRILSLASFYTSDGFERTEAKDFFGKINRLLAQDGIFFYESTFYPQYESSPDIGHKRASEEAREVICSLFKVEKEWEAKSGQYWRYFGL